MNVGNSTALPEEVKGETSFIGSSEEENKKVKEDDFVAILEEFSKKINYKNES